MPLSDDEFALELDDLPIGLVEGVLSENGYKILRLVKDSWPSEELANVMGFSLEIEDTNFDTDYANLEDLPEEDEFKGNVVAEPFNAAIGWAMEKLGIPLDDWPEEYLGYAIEHIVST